VINIVFRVCAKNPLRELGINYVYYLCPIKNLKSILKFGIFSRNEMIRRNMVFYDYSEHSIQERRKENGYHDMVPTFFNTRNAMTFRWEKESV
jgi:hypothetical protein